MGLNVHILLPFGNGALGGTNSRCYDEVTNNLLKTDLIKSQS
jgi:hypothetical protein